MKTPTILLSLTLSLVAGGCIDVKDVGVESDASSGGSMSEGAGESESSATTGLPTDTVTASGTATMTESGTDTAATQTGSETGVDTMETATITSGETDTFGGSGSSTGSDTDGGEEEELCEASGGGWDPTACGHYVCGLPQECQAVIPGCDCGEHRVFVDGLGCQVGSDCDAYEFDCYFDQTCSAPSQYCDIVVPGVPDAPVIFGCPAVPEACTDDYSCECLEAEGLVEEGASCEADDVGGLSVVFYAP